MKHTKKRVAFLLAVCLLCLTPMADCEDALAKTNYTGYMYMNTPTLTVYTDEKSSWLSVAFFSCSDAETVRENLIWTTSDPSVAQFITDTIYENGSTRYETTKKYTKKHAANANVNSGVYLLGLSEGTTTIKAKSKLLNQTVTCKVTVKDCELTVDTGLFFSGNTYQFTMKGNATATSYNSTNKKIASIDDNGMMTAKKAGKTTITCTCADGNTYKYKVKVEKPGLSYTKLTGYYYTGMNEGCYESFPLVAEGIDVKSWKSSNKKVCVVTKQGRIGCLEMRSTGKATITCTATNGKQYKCELTVVGGQTWGGLGGYRPTLSTLKKHGYFKDINTVKDYGDAIVVIHEYDHEFSLGNGNKPLDRTSCDQAKYIMNQRYPYSFEKKKYPVKNGGTGDYLCFTNDAKTKSGRIWVEYYYVEE